MNQLFFRVHANPPPAFKFHFAVHLREQSVIFSFTHVHARFPAGTALADNDGAGVDLFAAECFYPEPFGFTVASIFRMSLCLFMCHGFCAGDVK